MSKEGNKASEKKGGDVEVHHSREEFRVTGENVGGKEKCRGCVGSERGGEQSGLQKVRHVLVFYMNPLPHHPCSTWYDPQCPLRTFDGYQDVRSPAPGGPGGCRAGQGTVHRPVCCSTEVRK